MVSKFSYGQDFSELYGFLPLNRMGFRLNSIESNTGNFSNTKDWEFSVSSGLLQEGKGGSLFLISAARRVGNQYFYLRYTPGFRKDFLYTIGSVVKQKDSSQIVTNLNRNLSYRENFAFGYSIKLKNNLTLGSSLRNFNEEFKSDEVEPFFSDTLNYINIFTTQKNYNFWRWDFGVTYLPFENLLISVNSENAVIIGGTKPEGYQDVLMKNERSFNFRIDYEPITPLTISAYYSGNGAFQAGGSFVFNLLGGKFTASVSAFESRLKTDTFVGIAPAINFSNDYLSLTLSGVKKIKGEKEFSLNYFLENGLTNLVTNVYNSDRVTLSVNFALSFSRKPNVKFLGLTILKNIYPALSRQYLIKPIARARVVNVSGRTITVKPAVKISEVDEDEIFSPLVSIGEGDTADVFFYYSFDGSRLKSNKEKIATAEFYLLTNREKPDDKIEKPILVYSKNAWDGNVADLKYFSVSDFNAMQKFAKKIINANKFKIKKKPDILRKFETTKILFEELVGKLNYVADQRSSVDRVQYPSETLKLKGGDCDDLSVLFSSILESVGIQTAFVDYRNPDGVSHVNLLVNTELSPEYSYLITKNPNKFIVRKNISGKNEIWIPIEMTRLTTFEDAWSVAAMMFQREAINKLGLAKSKVKIFDNN